MLIRASTFDHGVLAISGPRGPVANLAINATGSGNDGRRRDAWERDANNDTSTSSAGQARDSGSMLPREVWESNAAKVSGFVWTLCLINQYSHFYLPYETSLQ
jgi:hypothetical protein